MVLGAISQMTQTVEMLPKPRSFHIQLDYRQFNAAWHEPQELVLMTVVDLEFNKHTLNCTTLHSLFFNLQTQIQRC